MGAGGQCFRKPSAQDSNVQVAFYLRALFSLRSHRTRSFLQAEVSDVLLVLAAQGTSAEVYTEDGRTPQVVQRKGRLTNTVP